MPITLIAVILRLGKKYDTVGHFLKEAVARLKHEFPRNLSDWHKISGQSFSKIVQSGELVLLDIIILPREAGLQSILPLTYYLFCGFDDPMVRTRSCDGQATNIKLLTHNRNKYIQHTRLNTEPRPLPRRMYEKF